MVGRKRLADDNPKRVIGGDGKSLGSVAGQRLGAQSGMQDGSFVKPREDKPVCRSW
jgi:hypothetical protein